MSSSTSLSFASASSAASKASSASPLTRDAISLILPFLSLHEFATSAAIISRCWYSTARTMRSRHDRCTINYFQDHNQPQHQLLHTSSLRHHVTHLHAQLFSPTKDEIKLATRSANSDATVAATAATAAASASAIAYRRPSHLDQLNWLNMISHSMPHIESLEVHFILSPNDSTDSQLTPNSIHFPPRLCCLKFHTTMIRSQQGESIKAREMTDEVRFEKWMVRLFSAITSSDALCSSLLILESMVEPGLEYPTSVVAASSLYKLTSLRRLALRSPCVHSAVDDAFINAIRAMPKLSEFDGPMSSHFPHLLHSPCTQLPRRLSESALVHHSSSFYDVPIISLAALEAEIQAKYHIDPVQEAEDLLRNQRAMEKQRAIEEEQAKAKRAAEAERAAAHSHQSALRTRARTHSGSHIYTWDEIRLHKSAESCWLVVEGTVYDVTPMLATHPAGIQSILRNAGTEATEHFKFHSRTAHQMWKKYEIGVLDGYKKPMCTIQ